MINLSLLVFGFAVCCFGTVISQDTADGIDTSRCKYQWRSGNWSECDPETDTRTKVVFLRRGDMNGECPLNKTLTRSCRVEVNKCRYVRRGTPWSECEDGQRNKVMPLMEGQNENCQEFKTITKPCRMHGNRPNRDRGRGDGGRRRGHGRGRGHGRRRWNGRGQDAIINVSA